MGQLNRTCRMNASWFLCPDASCQVRSSGKFKSATDQNTAGFAVAGPHLWSMLSASLHLVDNFARFKHLLNVYLFS